MEETRRLLSEAILRLLGDGKPRTAREMAVQVRSNHNLNGIVRGDVNSVLYGELASQLTRDVWFRWSLARGFVNSRIASAALDREVSVPTASDRRALLLTVHRLRAGLPPLQHVAELTVGSEHLCTPLSRFLHNAGAPRWMVITGNYGEGKSHSLALLRELAHQEGYATCQLSADGSLAALNHPQRFLPLLLATLETPAGAARGYGNLLFEFLSDDGSRDRVKRIVQREIIRHLPRADAEHLGRALTGYNINNNSDSLVLAADQIALHLSGESIQHRPATEGTRIFAYSLLRIALEILVASGLKGLVVLIDETESISTKLPGIRSRLGAYRVLSALCESPELINCKVCLAATPDALRQFAAEIPMMINELGKTPGEPVQTWAKRLKEGPMTLACRRLEHGQRGELLNSVRRIYSQAYQGTFRIGSALGRADDRSLPADVPTRILVRSAVDRLDAHRWASRLRG
jgi:hypothetical protein